MKRQAALINIEAASGRRGAFPQLLWTLLENPMPNPLSALQESIVEWCDDGVSFVIRDGAALEKFVLPQYFKSHRLDSFLRQLSYHDFTQIDARALGVESRAKSMRVYTHKMGLFSLQLGEAESVLIQRRRPKKGKVGMGNRRARNPSSPDYSAQNVVPNDVLKYKRSSPKVDSTQSANGNFETTASALVPCSGGYSVKQLHSADVLDSVSPNPQQRGGQDVDTPGRPPPATLEFGAAAADCSSNQCYSRLPSNSVAALGSAHAAVAMRLGSTGVASLPAQDKMRAHAAHQRKFLANAPTPTHLRPHTVASICTGAARRKRGLKRLSTGEPIPRLTVIRWCNGDVRAVYDEHTCDRPSLYTTTQVSATPCRGIADADEPVRPGDTTAVAGQKLVASGVVRASPAIGEDRAATKAASTVVIGSNDDGDEDKTPSHTHNTRRAKNLRASTCANAGTTAGDEHDLSLQIEILQLDNNAKMRVIVPTAIPTGVPLLEAFNDPNFSSSESQIDPKQTIEIRELHTSKWYAKIPVRLLAPDGIVSHSDTFMIINARVLAWCGPPKRYKAGSTLVERMRYDDRGACLDPQPDGSYEVGLRAFGVKKVGQLQLDGDFAVQAFIVDSRMGDRAQSCCVTVELTGSCGFRHHANLFFNKQKTNGPRNRFNDSGRKPQCERSPLSFDLPRRTALHAPQANPEEPGFVPWRKGRDGAPQIIQLDPSGHMHEVTPRPDVANSEVPLLPMHTSKFYVRVGADQCTGDIDINARIVAFCVPPRAVFLSQMGKGLVLARMLADERGQWLDRNADGSYQVSLRALGVKKTGKLMLTKEHATQAFLVESKLGDRAHECAITINIMTAKASTLVHMYFYKRTGQRN